MRIFCYYFLASVRKYVYLCIVIKKQSKTIKTLQLWQQHLRMS